MRRLALLLLVPGIASAEVPATVTTAITTAGTDVATIGGAVLSVIVLVFAFRLMRSSLR
jgi:hypothetical protein